MAVEYLGTGNDDGVNLGRSSTDKIGFYGLTTPIVRPSGTAQAAVTDGSTGTANPTTGIAALTATYNSTLLINAIATLAAQGNALRNALVSLNLIAGA